MPDFSRFNNPLDAPVGSGVAADPTMYSRHVLIKEGTVNSVRKLTYDTYELIVRCDDDGEALNGSAGQYATLKPEHIDKPRAYSFARAPECEKPGEHTFFIRLIHSGVFSGWLFDKDRVGEKLTISGPLGSFGLDPSDQPMLCIAGGSGMSAIFAILEHAVVKQVARDAFFFYGARTQKDLYMVNEIQQFAQRWHADFKLEFIPVLSEEPEGSDWSGARGLVVDYVDQKYLKTGEIDVSNCVAYFCGPPPMIDAGIDVLQGHGMSPERIRYDKFEDARSPAPVIDNTLCVLCDECLMVKPIEKCIVEIAALHTNGNGTRYKVIQPAQTSGLYYNSLYIDDSECIRCYACVDACPAGAIHPAYDKTPTALRRIADTED